MRQKSKSNLELNNKAFIFAAPKKPDYIHPKQRNRSPLLIALAADKSRKLQKMIEKCDIDCVFNNLDERCINFILTKIFDHRAGINTQSNNDSQIKIAK